MVDSKFGEEGDVDEGVMRVRREVGVDGKEYEWVCDALYCIVMCSAPYRILISNTGSRGRLLRERRWERADL